MKTKSWQAGLLQAAGLSAYILAVAYFMQNAESWVGRMNRFSGPVLFLSLFSFSALMCGLIAFFYPVKMLIEGKKQQGIETVLYTALFLFVFLVLVLFWVMAW